MFGTLAIGAVSTPVLTQTAFANETTDATYDIALKAYQEGDIATALIQGKMAGIDGNIEAQVLVGHILMRGEGKFIDLDDAAKWYLKAAALGHADAMVALGELALKSHGGMSPADAVKWLHQASEKGRTDAMRALAEIYFKGQGTAPDKVKAESWLMKAANYGDRAAESKLGDVYFETDPKTALSWYEKSAEHGDANSAYIAAIMYAENFEIKPDAAKAAKLLSQAADAGIPAAQADYGLIVYQGNGVPRSAEKAATWFKRAAEGGDSEGRFLYAFTLAKGDGVPKSFEDSYYWLLKAEQDSGKSGINEYDQSRVELKQRLENNVSPDILARARARVAVE